MRNDSRILKWGNSLAVRIPLAIAKKAGLGGGDSVKLTLDANVSIVLRPTRRKYGLSERVDASRPRIVTLKQTGRGASEEAW
jgi:antitoxin component of MazEF toxin-antitoxin module